ncbi:hypothetical protein [Allobaculum sp. Allo2]|uniref:hypothetical protein n=1 Tax=Allobaculum sp. Allo2 TaxID=2853432 RepID=UPI001F60206B|nr:hypothetical protein [Allobaculum sp. Allo2]UNT92802.1 hypothetical protein KWG61_12025 [Allobaculum sp. Allo2]
MENSDQTQAEINANIDMLKAETAGGVAYEKAVDAIVDKQQEKVAEKAVAASDQTVAEVNAAKKFSLKKPRPAWKLWKASQRKPKSRCGNRYC